MTIPWPAIALLATAVGAAALTLESGPARMTIDPENGAITSIGRAGASETIFRGGEDGAWALRFRSGATLAASAFHATNAARRAAVRASADRSSADLVFESAEVHATVFIRPRAEGFDLAASVSPISETMLELSLPGRLRFDPAGVNAFVAPLEPHKGVGAAFNAAFFGRQTGDHPSVWWPEPSPSRGLAVILPRPPVMRDLHAPAVPLRPTPEGVRLLGTNLADRFFRARGRVQRPPAPGQAEVVLVESDAGPMICAHAVGSGFLWRFTGQMEARDAGLFRDAAARLLRAACAAAPGRRRLALAAVRNGPDAGAFTTLSVLQWRETLTAVARETGREFVELGTPADILDALGADRDAAIVNPYGEWLPVAPGDTVSNMVAQIARHVRSGGVWFETGGFPFHAALRPAAYLRCESTYPPLFADFVHLDSTRGRAAVYRVQPRTWGPWAAAADPSAMLVPGRLGWGGDERGGWMARSFAAFVPPGGAWTSPAVRIAIGGGAGEALAAYSAANGIRRTLPEKMRPDVLDRLRRATLINIQGSAEELLAALSSLPAPAILHNASYLKGGFDKEYPDHLPPNPAFGTLEQMRRLHERARAAGHLVMPYTNPTWWCDNPRGPTFLAVGDAPLAIGLDGRPYRERYGGNEGWTTCLWHPAVRTANRELRRQFLEDVPVDILFQDQVGARGWRWDFNTAAPAPHAYAEGLLSQADEDTALVPLGTEDGWDGVVNAESLLCGFTFALVPGRRPEWARPFRAAYPPRTWTLWPLAQMVAHDKCIFFHHDLGKFVTGPAELSWTLALGFSMSYRLRAADAAAGRLPGWLAWIDRIQKSVCARYTGRPVAAFEHRPAEGGDAADDDGVVRAAYGDVTIVANLGPLPRREGVGDLAGYGFRATAPGLAAGHLASLGGASTPDGGFAFVAEDGLGQTEVWVLARPGAQAAAELPAGVHAPDGDVLVIVDGSAPVRLRLSGGALRFAVPAGRDREPRLWHAVVRRAGDS